MIFHTAKTVNEVITWRGVKKINRKPQLVGGGDFGPIHQKSDFETVQFHQTILDMQTYIYSQHSVTRTLRGMKNLFEIANVRVIERILYGRGFQGKNKFYRMFELSHVDCI